MKISEWAWWLNWVASSEACRPCGRGEADAFRKRVARRKTTRAAPAAQAVTGGKRYGQPSL